MNKLNKNLILSAGIVIMSSVFSVTGQDPTVPPLTPPVIVRGPVVHPHIAPMILAGDNSERSIKVDPSVNLQLCVTQGTVKINGWKRNELRVYVQDGSKFGFKVLQTNPRTQEPVWISVTGVEGKNKFPASTDCIFGGEIEIDLPLNTTVNIRGRDISTTVDSVRKVNINTAGGDISLRNITEGITAATFQGDVTVEESNGTMNLETTTGNILVFDAGPEEIGDTFKAKTNSGAISLQGLGHRQIDVSSISGSVAFSGEILNGGTYNLTTLIGSIRMSIPQNSVCSVSATYGYGNFNSDIPFKLQTENITEGNIKNVVGVFGAGGNATLKLTTSNGSIGIKKL